MVDAKHIQPRIAFRLISLDSDGVNVGFFFTS